ncbi:MAG: nucleotide exchange factor GrpE [Chromatiaceae bacterium]|nr:nucleotide exchange factor GrpE [Chromatiaceae bacterium]
MSKARIRAKLIELQKAAIGLSAELQARERAARETENDLFLELVGVLDAFENLFNNLSQDVLDKSAKRAFKSVGAIQRKLTRLLEARGLEKLEFPDARARAGLCRVVETQATDEVEEGTILAVVRTGYRRGEQILRPAEVITASGGRGASEAPPSE